MIVVGIPIGMVLAISGFLPNLFDPMFPVDPQYIIRSMVNGVDSFPIFSSTHVYFIREYYGEKEKFSEKLLIFLLIYRKSWQQDYQ